MPQPECGGAGTGTQLCPLLWVGSSWVTASTDQAIDLGLKESPGTGFPSPHHCVLPLQLLT